MLDETIKQPDPSFKPARLVKPVKPGDYRFGDGIAALAKNDPGLLTDLAASPETHGSLGATFVLGEVKAAGAAKKKKGK